MPGADLREVGVDGRHMLPGINPDWSSLWWAGPPTPSSGWVTKSPPDLAQPAEQNGTSLWEAPMSLPHNNSSKTWATKKTPDEEAWTTKSQCLPNTNHHLLPSIHFKCCKNDIKIDAYTFHDIFTTAFIKELMIKICQAHLSKRPSDLKINGTHENVTFSGPVFHGL